MSTPSDPETAPKRPALEPTHILARRRPGALSELVRQVNAAERARDEEYEILAVPAADTTAPSAASWQAEDDTQELPPVVGEQRADPPTRGGPRRASPRTAWLRRTAIAVAAVATALAGFGAALLLTWDRDAGESQARPPAASVPPPEPATPSRSAADPGGAADPDGPGTLREGDSGPDVSELQERLLRIPNVYQDGSTSGEYDATLTAAVARFQLWYGIRGDETGVYGNDTRRDLESRTAS
ncbi:peptidoglycan-binding protein [Streptomyces montanus]|uniref:Peptidoglycan-binding protein n=1 Tax=Streptomyces montanus TaxID=2580423 RepID=A0A5R9FWN4_9ACTN|nr:peptidoglycan-binding domain-containing protein [Streptomyces montanus]TLS47089.1 peptidoglycan-binding protein [Streptomyces montanus]